MWACTADRTGPLDEPVLVPIAMVLDVSQIAAANLVVVEVTGPGIDPPLGFNLPITNGVASGTITVPAGADRTITVSIYDEAGTRTHRGSATVQVVAGTNPTVTIRLSPLTGDVPIAVTIGTVAIAVSPVADTLFIGDTVRLAATVVGSAGDTLAATVQWATLDPSRAVVDTAGLITAVATGDVGIVATYAGVAARADITVLPALAVAPFVGNGQIGLVGYATNIRPAVRVTDGSDNPVSGVTVTFAAGVGGGSATDSVVSTNADGIAQVGAWTLGANPGPNTMVATVDAPVVTGSPVTFTATGFAASYDITLLNVGPALSNPAQVAFDSAVAKWQRVIYRDLPDVPNFTISANQCGNPDPIGPINVDDVLIIMSIDSIDGPSQILGQAGPCFIRTDSRLTIAGVMKFDSADVRGLIDQGRFNDVIVHEMGHVLGVGTLWSQTQFDCLELPSSSGVFLDTYYDCVLGREAFDSLGGTAYTGGNKVPVENCEGISGCGGGTRNSHWREFVFDNELMTGYLNSGSGNPLSILTAASLADLGYVVNLAGSDPYSRIFTAPAAVPGERIDLGDDIWPGPIIVIER